MRGLTRDTVVEMIDRKSFWVFVVVTALMLLAVIGSMSFDIQLYSEGSDLKELIGDPLIQALGRFMTFLVFLAVLATAGLIPNMFIKGRADYYLSKPMTRGLLFYTKFFGIWFTYGGVITLCGVVVYIAMVLVYGGFNAHVIWIFLLNLISLFIWLSITAFAGIVFGSGSTAIMAAFMVWGAQLILQSRDFIKAFADSRFLDFFVDTLYYIIPKTGALSDITLKVASGGEVTDWVPLYGSLIFALILLPVTVLVFDRKNY